MELTEAEQESEDLNSLIDLILHIDEPDSTFDVQDVEDAVNLRWLAIDGHYMNGKPFYSVPKL